MFTPERNKRMTLLLFFWEKEGKGVPSESLALSKLGETMILLFHLCSPGRTHEHTHTVLALTVAMPLTAFIIRVSDSFPSLPDSAFPSRRHRRLPSPVHHLILMIIIIFFFR